MSHRQLGATDLEVGFGGRSILKRVSLEIPQGRRLALLGANGSGKTTLLRTLAGSVKPERGAVLVDGSPVKFDRRGLRAHRQVVQLVAQNPDDQLFAADVFRDVSFGPLNLGLPEAEVKARTEQALALLSIEDLGARPIHELSYGQRKRVAIAGALAMQPCVVLLDEPTAGLDPQGVAEMVEALEGLRAAHTTVVIATHEVDFALAWADSAAVLVEGRLQQGAPEALLGDAALVGRARLRRPLVLEVAAEFGLTASGLRNSADLVVALRAVSTSGAAWPVAQLPGPSQAEAPEFEPQLGAGR